MNFKYELDKNNSKVNGVAFNVSSVIDFTSTAATEIENKVEEDMKKINAIDGFSGIHVVTNPKLQFITNFEESAMEIVDRACEFDKAIDKAKAFNEVHEYFRSTDESSKQDSNNLHYHYQIRGMIYGPYNKRYAEFDAYGSANDDTDTRVKNIKEDMKSLGVEYATSSDDKTGYTIRMVAPYNYRSIEVYDLPSAEKIIYAGYDRNEANVICDDLVKFFNLELDYKIL